MCGGVREWVYGREDGCGGVEVQSKGDLRLGAGYVTEVAYVVLHQSASKIIQDRQDRKRHDRQDRLPRLMS